MALRACQKVGSLARGVVIAFALAASIVGCATPSERFDVRARALGFERVDIDAGSYRIALFRSALAPARAGPSAPSATLHVYLEGDGTPFVRGVEAAADPTPRRPFALELAARDRSAAVLIGRPCYHGHASDPGCGVAAWTSARYGEAIVASVAAAIDAARADRARITLIGYSGGGVLARLVAERAADVERVITVAANLDVAAWSREHGYQPLDASLDPATRAPLANGVEIDLVGARDANVPPATLDAYAAQNPNARIVRFADYDHRCCWIDAWPRLLEQFAEPP